MQNVEVTAQPEAPAVELDGVNPSVAPTEERPGAVEQTIVFSESESCRSSPSRSIRSIQQATPPPLAFESDLLEKNSLESDLLEKSNSPIHNSPIHNSPENNLSENNLSENNSPPQTPSPSVSTPPRSSLKRKIICNDSPLVTPSKMQSVSQPVFVTPVKSIMIENKTAGVSPTKVVEEEAFKPIVFENKPIVLTVRMKRLLKEQEEERNRFRSLMQTQVDAIQETFNIGLPRWNGV